jgi:hypothetical protein
MTLTATITHVAQSGAPDDYGDPTEQTSTTTALCEFQQQQRSEDTVDADRQSESWTLFVEPDATIDGGDRIEIDGVTYQVDGPPWHARNPRTQIETHIEARVRRVV